MEGLIEPACCAKRPFIILPILLTLTIFSTTLCATNKNPTSPTNELTFKAVPIIANTLAAYHNLKTAQATQPKETIKQLDAAQLESVAVVSEKESKVAEKTIAREPVALIKEVKMTSETSTAMEKMTSTSFSFAAMERTERRQYIAYFAESHTDWGFRYRFGGTAIDNGIDCSAFTRYVLGYFDIKAPRTSGEQYDVGEKITVEQARAGDLVFFGSKKNINHVALVVSNDEQGLVVVHSCNSGIVKENISKSSYWKPKLKSMAVNLFDSSQTQTK
jgi:cell wall-associated NlpC family hydrolase